MSSPNSSRSKASRQSGLGLPLSPRSGEIPRQAPADRQHPRRARKPVPLLSAAAPIICSTNWASRSSTPTSAARPGLARRFVGLDNGPFKREDSVKDIGAFLDALRGRSGDRSGPIAVTGGSYGGYMCYASAIRYGARFKAADCIVAISNFVTFLENTQGLSPRSAPGRIWRRARSQAARQAARNLAADPDRRAQHPAAGRHRRQRSARARRAKPTRSSPPSAPRAAPPGTWSARTKATASPRRRTPTTSSGPN